jgi:hypothetical protein
MARRIVQDPLYYQALWARAVEGELAPAVEVTLWHYAFGKPTDRVEVAGAGIAALVAGNVYVQQQQQQQAGAIVDAEVEPSAPAPAARVIAGPPSLVLPSPASEEPDPCD